MGAAGLGPRLSLRGGGDGKGQGKKGGRLKKGGKKAKYGGRRPRKDGVPPAPLLNFLSKSDSSSASFGLIVDSQVDGSGVLVQMRQV